MMKPPALKPTAEKPEAKIMRLQKFRESLAEILDEASDGDFRRCLFAVTNRSAGNVFGISEMAVLAEGTIPRGQFWGPA